MTRILKKSKKSAYSKFEDTTQCFWEMMIINTEVSGQSSSLNQR